MLPVRRAAEFSVENRGLVELLPLRPAPMPRDTQKRGNGNGRKLLIGRIAPRGVRSPLATSRDFFANSLGKHERPEAAALYCERAPLFTADRLRDPIALFQGEVDQVVPQAQADAIVASLKSRGVPHEYHVYAGEGHGWRKAETIAHFYTTVDVFLRQYVLFA